MSSKVAPDVPFATGIELLSIDAVATTVPTAAVGEIAELPGMRAVCPSAG